MTHPHTFQRGSSVASVPHGGADTRPPAVCTATYPDPAIIDERTDGPIWKDKARSIWEFALISWLVVGFVFFGLVLS